MLRGENVLLRPVRRADITHFLKWFNDPEVLQFLGAYLPMTEMGEEKYIEELGAGRAKSDVSFLIEWIDGDTNQPIGTVGLHGISAKDHNATFGIAIGEKDYWSKGIGTEAARLIIGYGFEQLNLHRVNSTVLAFNERSIRLHRKLGFREEGRQREALFKNGTFHDLVGYGILRAEWSGRTSAQRERES